MTALNTLLIGALVGIGSTTQLFSTGRTFGCKEEGIFPDSTDCTSYFTCIRNASSAGFTSRRRSCPPSTAYSRKSSTCVAQEEVPECSVSHRQAREENSRAPEYDHLCAKDGFRCGDCKHFIDCKDKKAYLQETCDPDHTCQMQHKNFPHGVCYHREDDPTVCACLIGHVQMPDPFNVPFGYIDCPADNKDPEVHRCPKGEIYNDETMICQDPDNYPDCHKQGEFPVPKDCTKFYHCTHNSHGGFVKLHMSCENPLHQYDEMTHKCSDPCDWNWSPDHFTCKKEGFFQHPSICTDYFKCMSDGTGGFNAKHLCCPKHMNFQFDGKHSGKCVPEEDHPCIPAIGSKHSRSIHCIKPDYCERSLVL